VIGKLAGRQLQQHTAKAIDTDQDSQIGRGQLSFHAIDGEYCIKAALGESADEDSDKQDWHAASSKSYRRTSLPGILAITNGADLRARNDVSAVSAMMVPIREDSRIAVADHGQ